MQRIIGFFIIFVIGIVLAVAGLRLQRVGPTSVQMASFQNCMSSKRENYATIKASRMKVDPSRAMNPAFAFDEDLARAECMQMNGIHSRDF